MKFPRRQRQPLEITVTVRGSNPLNRVAHVFQAVTGDAIELTERALVAARVTSGRAAGATASLQVLPDAALIRLAAASVGVGTGFYLARQRRLVVALGMVPALLAGVAILLRPIPPAPAVTVVES